MDEIIQFLIYPLQGALLGGPKNLKHILKQDGINNGTLTNIRLNRKTRPHKAIINHHLSSISMGPRECSKSSLSCVIWGLWQTDNCIHLQNKIIIHGIVNRKLKINDLSCVKCDEILSESTLPCLVHSPSLLPSYTAPVGFLKSLNQKACCTCLPCTSLAALHRCFPLHLFHQNGSQEISFSGHRSMITHQHF